MRTPSTTDPHFVLCDEYVDQSSAESQVSLVSFQRMVAEMQVAITELLDMPTRCSFSWTCSQYFASHGDRDFNPFAFADKCAELGYRALLKYSVERRGPFDFMTATVAAKHGQLDVLQLYVRHKCNNHMPVRFEEVPPLLATWAAAAAETGKHRVLAWLKVEQWRSPKKLWEVAKAAMRHDHATALKLYAQVQQFDNPAYPADSTYNYSGVLAKELLNIAYATGNLEAVLRLKEMGHFYMPMEDKHIHPRVVSWVLAQYPNEDLNVLSRVLGATYPDNIELLELAVHSGANVTIDDFSPERHAFRWPDPRLLKHLHERFNIERAPFREAYPIPPDISRDDLQWMLDQGYQFDNTEFHPHCFNIELLPILLQLGFSPDSVDMLHAAFQSRCDLLEAFWQIKTDDLLPDATTVASLVRSLGVRLGAPRFKLKLTLRTIEWFLAKGYTFGLQTEPYDKFILAFVEHQPRLFKDYYEEIMALNMPLSEETRQRVENFLNKKP